MRYVTEFGDATKVINLQSICEALRSSKFSALPAYHAFSFAGKGKITCWKVFNYTSEDILKAVTNLGTTIELSDETILALESFACCLFLPKTTISKVKDLRWWAVAVSKETGPV